MNAQDVLDFWFAEPNRPFWFAKNDDFDQHIRSRFFPLWQQAAAGELADWRDTLRGRLAEIIVLDQFSRNLFRDSPAAFAQDLAAVCLSQEAVRLPGFATMKEEERHFILMPLMHSESRAIHTQAAAAVRTLHFRISVGLRIAAQSRHRPLRPLSAPQCRFGSGKHG